MIILCYFASRMSDRSFLTYLRPRHALALALLAGLALAAYANSFRAGFAQDNQALILEDPRLRVASSENLGLILHQTYWWPKAESGLYRPVTTLSYLLNYAILKNAASAAGYHWINLLLHVINAYLVYLLASLLLRRFWPAFFTAALWALHPVCTESVTNIVGRADELAACVFWEPSCFISGVPLRRVGGKCRGWRR